jgi:hypothetical protein
MNPTKKKNRITIENNGPIMTVLDKYRVNGAKYLLVFDNMVNIIGVPCLTVL